MKKPRLKLTCPWSDQRLNRLEPSPKRPEIPSGDGAALCSPIGDRQIQEYEQRYQTYMLGYLGWETHESRRTKLLQNCKRPDSHTTLHLLDTSQQEDKSSTLLQVPTLPYINRLFQIQLLPYSHQSMEQTASSY